MELEVQAFIAALREQFGELSVYSTAEGKSFVLTTPDGALTAAFRATPGDIVPIRATRVSYIGDLDPVAVYHLARADVRTNGLVRLSFLNGVDSGEDTTLATAIQTADAEIRASHG